VPKPNPGKKGDDKNKHGKNENTSSASKKLHPAADAYVHVMKGGLPRSSCH
jgi:hypothetical protein